MAKKEKITALQTLTTTNGFSVKAVIDLIDGVDCAFVIFDDKKAVKVIAIQEVRKRDERTY